MFHQRRGEGFTLIELLVVIAIIAILAVVVILTLNPSELLRQSRDSNRLSDLATINSAIGLYSEDTTGTLIGTSSSSYISIADPSATSTAGDQCQGLGLPAFSTSSGASYQCAATSSYRSVKGTGWIPLNFSTISSGAPMGALPVDPTNQTSSGLYYTYSGNGTSFMVTALLESKKYHTQLSGNSPVADFPGVAAVGTSFTISPLWSASGLAGYWALDEGSGSSTTDLGPNGNAGTWTGASSGGTHYVVGKVGTYAGTFDGSTDYVVKTSPTGLNTGTTTRSITGWIDPSPSATVRVPFVYGNGDRTGSAGQGFGIYLDSSNVLNFWSTGPYDFSTGATVSLNTWHYIAVAYDGSTVRVYLDGALVGAQSTPVLGVSSAYWEIGSASLLDTLNYYYPGLVDDVRIYNRSLSAAEVAAIYNSEK
jgi:prepilin-type N-terminal cleavage/methylation domain-containing protein